MSACLVWSTHFRVNILLAVSFLKGYKNFTDLRSNSYFRRPTGFVTHAVGWFIL